MVFENISFRDNFGEERKLEVNNFYCVDCMEVLKLMPDKSIDLCIVDPPYGINDKLLTSDTKLNKSNKFALMYQEKKWDLKIPDKIYFEELFRISKNQIIFGGNYFTDYLYPTRGWIVWDKEGDNLTVVNNELIWTSFDKALKMFRRCHGLDKGFMNKEGHNIHPTQKPIALYEWLLNNYAHKGDKIIDTHLGSCSSIIACIKLHFDYMGFELDKDYYDSGKKRIIDFTAQTSLFW